MKPPKPNNTDPAAWNAYLKAVGLGVDLPPTPKVKKSPKNKQVRLSNWSQESQHPYSGQMPTKKRRKRRRSKRGGRKNQASAPD